MKKAPTIRHHGEPQKPAEQQAVGIDKAVYETDDDGLILWMLELSPTRRLEIAQGFVDSITALKNGRLS